MEPGAMVEAVAQAGLQGRGGAGFPAGRKWRLVRESPVETRYLVANGGEDEPGSFKDRYLMEHHPHLILEGALIAAGSIGARHIFLYVNRTFDRSRGSLAGAIAALEEDGLLARLQVNLELFDAPECYVAGEDTAVLEVLEGRPPIPRKKPPYPVESGYRQSPTVVHNVETLANVPFIAREGADSYRRVGTAGSPGTLLFYLNEEFTHPGVYELPFGTRLRHLVEQLGGGLKSGRRIRAILPGGPSTAFLPADKLDLPLDHKSFLEAGSLLGCGNVRLIPEGDCMVKAALDAAKFFARESCGKCPQCRMETNAFVIILDKILAGNAAAALLPQLEAIAAFSRGKGDCGLIHMAAAPVLSAVKHFSDDFAAHLEGRACG
ncbi:MAG: SLBB domain-containing protein [Acidobacteria bacterium]|nr:SLBB domain-containing protein [Acidobacteriota bacterium]